MSASIATAPLPIIEDFNLLLEVMTHKDLRPTSTDEPREWGDNERLAELGASVLSSVVTIHLFSKRPLIRAEEIKTWREHYTSPDTLNSWLDSYQLKQKLRVPLNLANEIYNDLPQMAAYFHSYLAAVYLSKGLLAVQTWIAKLIDPDANIGPLNLPGHTPNYNSGFTGPASTSTSGPASTSSLSTSLNVPIGLVHEVATQKGCHINYVPSQEGESHQPTWTVRCYINNAEKGVGVGKTQKAAKEEAARQAWVAMGWP